jgi:predicted NAD-dependent protein-ADP-ribosyltransferase YbiA (DUF1768 family)
MENKNVIYIYDNKNIPFGPLSNNYFNYFDLYGKKWTTVTNFILSNMLINETYRAIVQNASIDGDPNIARQNKFKIDELIKNRELIKQTPCTEQERNNIIKMVNFETNIKKRNIFEVYNYYYGTEIKDTIKKACYDGYKNKIMKNNTLLDLLMETGEKKIFYISPTNNYYLGVNNNNVGDNYIGKALMQIRHEEIQNRIYAKDEKITRKEKEKIFSIYRILKFLEYEMLSEGDVNEKNKNIFEVENENYNIILSSCMRIMKKKYFKINNFDIEEIFKNYKNGKLDYIKEYFNVKNLQEFFRMRNSELILANYEYKRDYLIFYNFVKNVITTQNPLITDVELQIAIKELVMQAPSITAYKEKFQEIVDNYNLFPNKLKQKIENELREKNITIEKIKQLKKLILENKKFKLEERFINPEKYGAQDFQEEREEQKEDDKEYTYKLYVKKLKKYEDVETFTCKKDKLLKQVKKILDKKKFYRQKENSKKIYFPYKIIKLEKYVVKIKLGNGDYKEFYFFSKPTQNQISKILLEYSIDKIKDRLEIINLDEELEKKSERKIQQIPVEEPVFIYGDLNNNNRYTKLSPLFSSEKEMFSVDGLFFPSVSLYITTCLLSNQGITTDYKKMQYKRGMTLKNARTLLLVPDEKELKNAENVDFYNRVVIDMINNRGDLYNKYYSDKKPLFLYSEDADVIYKEIEKIYYYELMKTLQIISAKKKFQDIQMSNILLLTEQSRLVYDDPNDYFLGIGKDGKGENFCGKMLENLRDEIIRYNYENQIVFKTIDLKNVVNFISNDLLFEKWIIERVRDMCENSNRLFKYINYFIPDISLNKDFVENSTDLIFNPCSSVTNLINKQNLPLPTEEFKNFVYNIYYEKIEDVISSTTEKEEKIKNQEYNNDMTSLEDFKAKKKKQKDVFLKNIEKELSEEELQKKIQKERIIFERLLSTQKNETIIKKATEIFNKNIESFKKKLSPEEKKKIAEKFTEKQDKEIREYEIKYKEGQKLVHDINYNYEKEINTIKKNAQEKILQIKDDIKNISVFLWKRIITMIYFLIKTTKLTKQNNEQILRKLIYKLQKNLSEKDSICELKNVDFSLDNPYDNCICSAIINIISLARNFRRTLVNQEFPLQQIDFDLACSILLNKDIGNTLDSDFKQFNKPSFEDEEYQEYEEKKKDYENESDSDNLDDRDGFEDEENDEREPDNLDNFENEKNDGDFGFGNGIFSFVDKKDVLFSVIKKLSPYDTDEKIETNADLLDFHIKLVKDYKISENVKRNRINFFSTLKN